jgi:hypothetical protein
MNAADVAEAMAQAGCSAEQVAATLRVLKSKPSSAAARQKRYRDRNALRNVTSRYVTLPSPKKETSPTPPKEKTTLTLFPSVSANAETSPREENSTEIIDWFESQWNALAHAIGLASIRAMTDKRMRAIRCRADDLVRALGFADPHAGFTDTFNRIRGSPFLRGAANGGRAWKCDVDWLLTESNFLKVHEGKYAQEQRSPDRRQDRAARVF